MDEYGNMDERARVIDEVCKTGRFLRMDVIVGVDEKAGGVVSRNRQ